MRPLLLILTLLGSLLGCASASVTVACGDGGCPAAPDAPPATDGPAVGDRPAGTCPPPEYCNADAQCTTFTCSGVGWTCALDGAGGYGWTTGAADCDDGDACTTGDRCVAGTCQGAAVTCTTPPAPRCLAANVLETYAANGTCAAGQCTYPPTSIDCPANDCHSGTCSADPCAGKVCTTPPDGCHQATGTCSGGVCSYPLKVCTTPPDACHEATGTCSGGTCSYALKALNCNRPNATGGACQPATGQCGGWTCAPGWGNCTGGWDDGCETPLTTAANCGGCAETCTAPAHATASCATGACERACTAPWQNCDGDWSNGCEIPVGVANQCDVNGLNASSGCGTAYCGSDTSGTFHNFGRWYCAFCSNCHEFGDGSAWCLNPPSFSGQWSDQRGAAGGCGAYEDLTCGP
jgi:hypothetical protein